MPQPDRRLHAATGFTEFPASGVRAATKAGDLHLIAPHQYAKIAERLITAENWRFLHGHIGFVMGGAIVVDTTSFRRSQLKTFLDIIYGGDDSDRGVAIAHLDE